MRTRTLAAIALTASSAACGTAAQLSPAPQAEVAPAGPGEGAMAEAAGVQVEVRSRAWSSDPVTLETEITPLYLEITNNSDHAMLVRYESITLEQGGLVYPALPPYDIDESVIDDTYPDYSYYGYYWGGWSAYRTVELPTQDMRQMALPEGVLKPGQKITGFLFFDDLDDDISDVEFSLQLVDAASRRRFGTVQIPFVAH